MDKASPIDQFVEQMGLITQSEGKPRIAGRIFGLLLAEARPFTLNEMADRLKISKASASTNARLLLRAGLLQLTAKPGDRQDYYELGADPFPRMMETLSARMHASAERIRETEVLFPPGQEAARQRVRDLADFYADSAAFLSRWSAHIGRNARARVARKELSRP